LAGKTIQKTGERMQEQPRIDAAQIRALRRQRGWTQKELLFKSGVDQSLISDLENGKKVGPRIDTMVALARAFGVSVDDLFVPRANPMPVQPPDPQLIRIQALLKKMTPEDQELVITFARFIIAHRRRAEYSQRKLEKRGLLEE
jgi:transcriptional regulator with XRE-family HTH domain